MEYIFMADNSHRFYEKCLETYNEEKLAFEKAVELCAEYGIERDCVGMNSDNLFLNADWNYSAPHGAGRMLSRGKAKEVLKLEDFQEDMKNVASWSVSSSTLDEAPKAYKPAEMIINGIKDTVDIKYIAKTVYNFKG